MRIRKLIPALAIAFAIFVSSSLADAAVISVGDHFVPEGTTTYNLQILVTGGEQITDADIYLQIEDGGVDAGGTFTGPGPTVTNASEILTGSIWESSPSGYATTGSAAIGDFFYLTGVGVQQSPSTVSADGVLVTYALDLTGLVQGQSFSLSIGGTPAGDTTLYNFDTGHPTVQLVNGSITITAVPEPASLALMAGGALLVFRRRRG